MIAIQNDFGFNNILPRISDTISEMVQTVKKPKRKQCSTKEKDVLVEGTVSELRFDIELEPNSVSDDTIIKLIDGYSSVLQDFEKRLIHFNKDMLEGVFDRNMVLSSELIDKAISVINEHPQDIPEFKLNSILIDLLQSFQRINLILDSIYSEDVVDEKSTIYNEMIEEFYKDAGEKTTFNSNQKSEILAFLND